MKIKKIRVIPRGFKEIPYKDILPDINRGELFMKLYSIVGKPDKDNNYLLKLDTMVVFLSFTDRESDKVWVSPALMQNAKKRRSKTINLLARMATLDNVPFLIDEPFIPYFVVREKNDRLLDEARQTMSDEEIKNAFYDYIGKQRDKIDGCITQYLPEVPEILTEFTNIICL